MTNSAEAQRVTSRMRVLHGSFLVAQNVGRLIEERVWALDTVAEARSFVEECYRAALAVPTRVVICADFRAVRILAPEVALELHGLMVGLNDKIEKSAILVSQAHSTLAMQLQRLAREAHHPNRMRFVDPVPCKKFLEDALTIEERTRLAVFLKDGSDPTLTG